jgi:peptidoglycan/xylan/chitin deacetylase (PgdA/CDA1 family)
MRARYLLRFDDICPTMDWAVWDEIEAILHTERVRPIVAVVPDNQDPVLRVGPAEPCFWDRVRRWQALGWTVAMHGWQHAFVTTDSGVLRMNPFSEFAGLPREEQEHKLRSGRAVFEREGLDASMFVAPAHSFDETTLGVLRKLGFRHLSDGFFPFPHVDHFDLLWIPQQLWAFRRRPLGVWTICFHINRWSAGDISGFRNNVRRYRDAIIDVAAVVDDYGRRPKSVFDAAAAQFYRSASAGLSRARAAVQQLPV